MTSLTQEATAAMITVQTLLKGAIEVDENQLVTFVTPLLGFPLLMVRQNVEALLQEAFRIIDDGSFAQKRMIEIKPELLFG